MDRNPEIVQIILGLKISIHLSQTGSDNKVASETCYGICQSSTSNGNREKGGKKAAKPCMYIYVYETDHYKLRVCMCVQTK